MSLDWIMDTSMWLVDGHVGGASRYLGTVLNKAFCVSILLNIVIVTTAGIWTLQKRCILKLCQVIQEAKILNVHSYMNTYIWISKGHSLLGHICLSVNSELSKRNHKMLHLIVFSGASIGSSIHINSGSCLFSLIYLKKHKNPHNFTGKKQKCKQKNVLIAEIRDYTDSFFHCRL